MATFNVSFLNPSLRKSSGGTGSGILADRLSILQNELGKDGYLSSGDYDLLIKTAKDIQTAGGMTAAQISDYDVKISNFEKLKETMKYEQKDDITRLNNDLKNEAAEDVMVVGNNPEEFLVGRVKSLQAKMNALAETIERRDASGQDSAEYLNEYNLTMSEYNERMETLNSLKSRDSNNSSPMSGLVAYVKTNNKGEITDVDYGRYGSKSGYVETNGVINGFQVYGKINTKKDGKNYFLLGKNIFQAADILTPDPNNPGSFTSSQLRADVKNSGGMNIGQGGSYVNISPEEVSIQSYIPNNSWVKGTSGTIYKRRDDGGYSRYINVNEPLTDMPEIDDILTIPSSYEQSLMRNSDETIDASAPIIPDTGMIMTGQQPVYSPTQPKINPYSLLISQAADKSQTDGKMNLKTTKTPKQPTENNPATFGSTIQRTAQSGVNYLKSLFS